MEHFKIDVELQRELSDLNSRARKIDFKSKLPTLPKKPTQATMLGFFKRLANWKNVLTHLERERLLQRETITYDSNLLNNYLTK